MFIKPAPGIKVRDPITKAILPDDGKNVDDNDHYWVRRVRDGDVVVSQPNAPANKGAN